MNQVRAGSDIRASMHWSQSWLKRTGRGAAPLFSHRLDAIPHGALSLLKRAPRNAVLVAGSGGAQRRRVTRPVKGDALQLLPPFGRHDLQPIATLRLPSTVGGRRARQVARVAITRGRLA